MELSSLEGTEYMNMKGKEHGEWLSLLSEKIPCCSSPMATKGGLTGPVMLLFV